jgi:hypothetical protein
MKSQRPDSMPLLDAMKDKMSRIVKRILSHFSHQVRSRLVLRAEWGEALTTTVRESMFQLSLVEEHSSDTKMTLVMGQHGTELHTRS